MMTQNDSDVTTLAAENAVLKPEWESQREKKQKLETAFEDAPQFILQLVKLL